VSAPAIGVLALQGDTREHLAALDEAGARAITVRRRAELDAVDALVVPGGESTTMSLLLREFDLLEPLRARLGAGMPAYGSCAGMILLSSEILDAGAPGREAVPLGAIDMAVRRNAFGRQVDSFEVDLSVPCLLEVDPVDRPFHTVFIRAPIIASVGPGVEILSQLADGRIVAARQGQLLATSFHPELTGDDRFHRYFMELAK